MKLDKKFEEKILKVLKGDTLHEDPFKLEMSIPSFHSLKDINLIEDIRTGVPTDLLDVTITNSLVFKDKIIVYGNIKDLDNKVRSYIAVFTSGLKLLKCWDKVTFTYGEIDMPVIRHMIINQDDIITVLWVLNEVYYLDKLNDILSLVNVDKIFNTTTIPGWKDTTNKQVKEWILESDINQDNYFIIMATKDNTLNILEFKRDEDIWQEPKDITSYFGILNYGALPNSVQFIASENKDKDPYYVIMYTWEEGSYSDLINIRRKIDGWYDPKLFADLKEKLRMIGAIDIKYRLRVPTPTGEVLTNRFNANYTALTNPTTGYTKYHWYNNMEYYYQAQTFKWIIVDDIYSLEDLRIPRTIDELPDWSRGTHKIPREWVIAPFKSNGTIRPEHYYQYINYNNTVREYFPGPANWPTHQYSGRSWFFTAREDYANMEWAGALKWECEFIQTIPYKLANGIYAKEVTLVDDIPQGKELINKKLLPAISKCIRPTKNHHFIFCLIEDINHGYILVNYTQDKTTGKWTTTAQPMNLLDMNTINMTYTSLNQQESIITLFQQPNNKNITIPSLLFRNKDSGFNLDRSVSLIYDLKQEFLEGKFLALREQNLIKWIVFNPKYTQVVQFTNSYNNSTEASIPYFFQEYNNYKEDFALERVQAFTQTDKGQLLNFDGNVIDYNSSRNNLAFITKIDNNSLNGIKVSEWNLKSNSNNDTFSLKKEINKVINTRVNLSVLINVQVVDNTNEKYKLKQLASNNLTKLFVDKNTIVDVLNLQLTTIEFILENGNIIQMELDETFFQIENNKLYFKRSILNLKNIPIYNIIIRNQYTNEFFNFKQKIEPNQILDLAIEIAFIEPTTRSTKWPKRN